jgi:glycosyltransferase involved in cell wall biosynthesis
MLIRYYGHVGVPSGYGDAANEMCMAILSAGIELEIQTDGRELHKRFLPLAACVKPTSDLTPNPDVVIVHTLPLDCAKLLESQQIRETCPKALCVAYTTWEGYGLASSLFGAASQFDHVWVPSASNARAFNHYGSTFYIHTVPHPYDDGLTPTDRNRDAENLNDTYTFSYVGAWNARKNVEGVIRAYSRAFSKGDDVMLAIHCYGAPPDVCRVAQVATGLSLEQMPEVRFTNHRMTDDHMAFIRGAYHCFVTATRGEAWNLPAFQAMLAGQHIIAPGGQGSDDFLRGTSAYLYESRVVPAFGEVLFENITAEGATARYWGCQGLTVREDWMEPDIASLGLLMRRAWAQRVDRLEINYDPAARFGRAAVGRYVRDLLEGALR